MKAAMPISNTNKKLKRRARCKSYCSTARRKQYKVGRGSRATALAVCPV
jgi:hypothetical protein